MKFLLVNYFVCLILFNVDVYINNMINYHCKSGREKCLGSLLNPNSIEYISKAFKLSEDDSKKYLIERNKSPFYKKNHENEDAYKKFQSRGLNWYIDKFGDIDGTIRYNSFRKKVSFGNSSKALIEKYGIDGFNQINKKKAICNLSHFIKKYGEEEANEKFRKYKKSIGLTKENYVKKFGLDSWNNIRSNIEEKKSLNYFIETFEFESGLEKYNKLVKSFSFNKKQYIEKYGEEKWIKRWENCNKNFYSKESVEFFNILHNEIIKNKIEIDNIKTNKNEFFLWDRDYSRIYFYDFYFKTNNKKIIIEYDNYFWHPKKNSTEKNAWSYMIKNGAISINEKIEYDERKKLWAKYNGYSLITIYYSGKNPLRNTNSWDNSIKEAIIEIKKIIEC